LWIPSLRSLQGAKWISSSNAPMSTVDNIEDEDLKVKGLRLRWRIWVRSTMILDLIWSRFVQHIECMLLLLCLCRVWVKCVVWSFLWDRYSWINVVDVFDCLFFRLSFRLCLMGVYLTYFNK
jgi:hypothetical protein